MKMISALRDFADGLSRGLALFVTERNDFTERTVDMRVYKMPGRKTNR